MNHFKCNVPDTLKKCDCCYSCMENHSYEGCKQCSDFLSQYFPMRKEKTFNKSVQKELDTALCALFGALRLSNVKVENNLTLAADNLSQDIKRAIDEIHSPQDIVDFWHIPMKVAQSIFMVIQEVVFTESDLSADKEIESGDDDSCTESEHSPDATDDEFDETDTNCDSSTDSEY